MPAFKKVIDVSEEINILCDIILCAMKRIFLSTSNNSTLESLLVERGFTPTVINYPLISDDINLIENQGSKNDSRYLIAEFTEEIHESFQKNIHALKSDVYPLFLCKNPTEKTKKFLIDSGIPDLFTSPDPDRIASFIENINSTPRSKTKNIAVVNDTPAVKNFLTRLLCRFDIEPLFLPGIDSLFEVLDDIRLQMIFINLGTENLDLGKLIRSSYIDRQIKKVPVITFKDMNMGLFVHELRSGLNRLTKVILSAEELYSFLLDILYRKRVIPVVKALNGLVDFEENINYNCSTLMQIYNISGKDIFEMENILSEKRISGIYNKLDELKRIVIVSESLKWLKVESGKELSNCGVSGRS
jgi:hypothetical protein